MKKAVIGFIAGFCLAISGAVFAEDIEQFILTKVQYPLIVNQVQYENHETPILNYEGHTYIPLRSVGNILNADVRWNSHLQRVEITSQAETDMSDLENNAFRSLSLEQTGDYSYRVTGEVRVFEAVFQYALSDGITRFEENYYQADEGAPAWSAFTLDVTIPEAHRGKSITLELFEYSAKDGSITRQILIPLKAQTLTH